MKIALMTIATGGVYQNYAVKMFRSARRYFPSHDQIIFTDIPDMPVDHLIQVDEHKYPQATLYRYAMFTMAHKILSEYDQIFYSDADMLFISPVGDIFSPGLVATQHPGFYGKRGSFETNNKSNAYCPRGEKYFCGGFQGGDSATYLKASDALATWIADDEKKGIMATWHDESHWNAYLFENPPSKVLSPSYCYPEDYDGGYGWTKEQFPPILVALDKRKRGNHPRFK